MNWTIFAICCSALIVLCIAGFLVGMKIGMSIKFENEVQDTFKKLAELLDKQKQEEMK